jgi:hypothetical protein
MPTGGGVMPSNPKYSDDYYRARAKALHQQDGEVEVDLGEQTIVSRNDGGDDGAYVAAWVWVDNPTAAGYGQFETRCPKCGVCEEDKFSEPNSGLYVYLATLSSSGVPHDVHAALKADGFFLDLDAGKDQSTEDEMVRCGSCKAEFKLEELTLPEDA